MKSNKRYYGSVFCYEGTDYLVISKREINEIKSMLTAVRGDEEVILALNEDGGKKKKVSMAANS